MATNSGALATRDIYTLVGLTLVWGLNWPIMKMGVTGFPPLSFRLLSMLGGLVILFSIIKLRRLPFSIERQYWPEVFWLGFTNMVVWYACAIYGIKLLSSGRAAILGYTLPIWTAIFGVLFFKDKLSRPQMFGIACAACAVLILVKDELANIGGKPLGMFLMLISAAFWGYGTHLMRQRKVQAPLLVLMFWLLLQTALVCLVIALAIERDQWPFEPNNRFWFAVIYNAILVFGFAQLAWLRIASVLSPTASTISVMFIPVLGVFSSLWLIGDQPSIADYSALMMIVVAILLVLVKPKPAQT
jgi:drug/metabolite transporter (DMT)-like permease